MFTMPNLNNIVIYINNYTSKNLENCTIEHTGKGGHPIKLGSIKPAEKISEEMCILTSTAKSDLIFCYSLNGETYNSTVYNNIIFSDIRPITIDITEENGELAFSATRVTHEDITR